MTTYFESETEKGLHFISTVSRFPTSMMGSSLRELIRSAVGGVIVVDGRRQIVLVNQETEKMFGYAAENLLDKPLDLVMRPHTVDRERRHSDRLPSSRAVGKQAKVELKATNANGETLTLDANISSVTVQGELFLALVLHHPTGRDAAPGPSMQRPVMPAELRKWAASSQQATEVEKRQFSKKLYDDIGQRLSVLKLDLDWLENSLSHTDEGLPERLSQMQQLLDNVISTTKSMASALRPPLLDDFGLLPAVQWMTDNFQKRTMIACLLEHDGLNGKLDEAIESAIFRVIQEGLTNIERHSHAKHVQLAFARSENRLDVIMRDDGIGMASGNETKPGCYGLIAMQERVFALGGTINISNADPHGLVIHASIPVEPIFYNDTTSHPPTPRL